MNCTTPHSFFHWIDYVIFVFLFLFVSVPGCRRREEALRWWRCEHRPVPTVCSICPEFFKLLNLVLAPCDDNEFVMPHLVGIVHAINALSICVGKARDSSSRPTSCRIAAALEFLFVPCVPSSSLFFPHFDAFSRFLFCRVQVLGVHGHVDRCSRQNCW
jgi:hypothetical protein